MSDDKENRKHTLSAIESWQEYLKAEKDCHLHGTGIIKKEITKDGEIKTTHIPLQNTLAVYDGEKEKETE